MRKIKRPTVVCGALLALIAVAACADPYRVPPPGDVERRVQTTGEVNDTPDGDTSAPRPRAISICYSSLFNEPAEVMALAEESCPDQGSVERVEDDVFWNNCALFQPARASFLCTPGTPPPSKFQ